MAWTAPARAPPWSRMAGAPPLVEVQDLVVQFRVPGSRARLSAVDGVSLAIRRGETLGLVGESGCGKSTLGRAVIRLVEPAAGRAHFDGTDIGTLPGPMLRRARRRMQMVFQDPFASLNPRMTVAQILDEALSVHGLAPGPARRPRLGELLDQVGLPAGALDRYPHEFSGGQRQRIGIARALAVEPDFIVADEPVSALDVSIQAQTINLLMDLQQQIGLTVLFIAHDLAVVRLVSDRIAVMYLGRIVEIADSERLCTAPQHPYTQALLSAVPLPDPRSEATRQRIVLTGDVPSPVSPPSGCRFRTRCRKATERCAAEVPLLSAQAPGQLVACHFPGDAPG
jgi:oligopeptide transport system ATP-binding protein